MSSLATPDSDDRGQTAPIPALVAVVAVCFGITLYVGAHAGVDLGGSDRSPAEPSADRAAEALTTDGAVRPETLNDSSILTDIDAVPKGYEYRVTLELDDQHWHAGPEPPADAERATRRVPVESTPGAVRPGLLIVEVWS